MFSSSALVAAAFAQHLDLEAYDIVAAPAPGPVEEFQPVERLPPVPLGLPIDWGMDPFNDRTWQYLLHNLRWLDPALAAGDFVYARQVFRDWQRWHDGREALGSWADAVTGARAARLAYLLHSTGWRDPSLIELAEQHATKLQEPQFVRTDSNHGIAGLHGLAALCLDGTLRACRGAEPLLERKLDALLRNQFTRTGVHRENSPGYHFYALTKLSNMAPVLEAYSSDLINVLRRAKRMTRWLVHPDLTTVQLGDSDAAVRANCRYPAGTAGARGSEPTAKRLSATG
jgi:hypothetical protein